MTRGYLFYNFAIFRLARSLPVEVSVAATLLETTGKKIPVCGNLISLLEISLSRFLIAYLSPTSALEGNVFRDRY